MQLIGDTSHCLDGQAATCRIERAHTGRNRLTGTQMLGLSLSDETLLAQFCGVSPVNPQEFVRQTRKISVYQ